MACNRRKKMIYLTPEEMLAAEESTVFVAFILKMIREGNARTEMKVYHMSDTLCLGAELSLNYKKNWELTEPFVQALEKSTDCFYGIYFAAKFIGEALDRFGMADMQTDYVKWAAEGIFEYVRRKEYPQCCCRLKGNYYFDDLASCRELFEIDWGRASAEERSKIRLFEIELTAADLPRHDMRLFDQAYDDLYEKDDITNVICLARRYFSGEKTEHPIWEILSDQKAVAVRDLTEYLRES